MEQNDSTLQPLLDEVDQLIAEGEALRAANRDIINACCALLDQCAYVRKRSEACRCASATQRAAHPWPRSRREA
jgi:hypothetical protein